MSLHPDIFPLPYGVTVLRLRATKTTSSYSGKASKRDWTDPDRLKLEGVAIGRSSSVETVTIDGETVLLESSLYAPAGVDVRAEDRIACTDTWPLSDGTVVYECAGDPVGGPNPLDGWSAGSETRLRRVD